MHANIVGHKHTMDDLLNELLHWAQQQDRGMASVRVYWHPYKCQWDAQVDWSDNTRLTATGEEPSAAVAALLQQLPALPT